MRCFCASALIAIMFMVVHADTLTHLGVTANASNCSLLSWNQTLCNAIQGCAFCVSYNQVNNCYNLTTEQCCGDYTYKAWLCPSPHEGGSCCNGVNGPPCCGQGQTCCDDTDGAQCCENDSEQCCYSMGSDRGSCCPKSGHCCGLGCCDAGQTCCGDYNSVTWCCGGSGRPPVCGPGNYQCSNSTGSVVHVGRNPTTPGRRGKSNSLGTRTLFIDPAKHELSADVDRRTEGQGRQP